MHHYAYTCMQCAAHNYIIMHVMYYICSLSYVYNISVYVTQVYDNLIPV